MNANELSAAEELRMLDEDDAYETACNLGLLVRHTCKVGNNPPVVCWDVEGG